MTKFGPEPTFHTYLQILRHRKSWVGSVTVLGRAAYVRYRQAVATRQLAAAVAERRSLISGIEQQLRSFGYNTTSPEASALLNQEAVLKEQLAQMQVSEAVDAGGGYSPYLPQQGKSMRRARTGAAARRIAAGGALSGRLISLGTSGAAGGPAASRGRSEHREQMI